MEKTAASLNDYQFLHETTTADIHELAESLKTLSALGLALEITPLKKIGFMSQPFSIYRVKVFRLIQEDEEKRPSCNSDA